MTTPTIDRYSRHLALPGFNDSSQALLKNARVLVVGCGGLGHPVLQYLTSSGIGTIGIADNDQVAMHNLHRQILFTEEDIGQSKTIVAIDRLKRMNSETTFIEHPLFLNTENGHDIVKIYDLVVDCSDNFPARYLLDDICQKLQKPMIYAALHRHEGHVSVFHGKKKISYRDLFPIPPSPDVIPDCSTGGVIGTLAGTIGCIQANEVIKILTGTGVVLDGQLLIMNLQTNESQIIQLKKRTNEKTQIENKTTTNINNMIKEITASELKTMMDGKEDFQLIDVREPYENAESNLGGILIPMNSLPQAVDQISKNKKVIVHCRAGSRSASVIRYLQQEHGFDNLYNLQGGILEWNAQYGK